MMKPKKAEFEVLKDTVVTEQKGKIKLRSVGISKECCAAVKGLGVRSWFAMQESVISCILWLERSVTEGDVIVSAPTGSGKTLAYAVPIVESLRGRYVRRLQAVILAPTRDLASQVKSIFDELSSQADLHVALAVGGGESLAKESSLLVDTPPDILVATPGRLVHHLTSTKGFNLSSLRFLVVDESDRLLQQDYNNWVEVVMQAISSPLQKIVERDQNQNVIGICTARGEAKLRVRKILVSATQTRNPKRLAGLRLRHVRRFTARGVTSKPEKTLQKFSVPSSLTESAVVVDDKTWKLAELFSTINLDEEHGTSWGHSVIIFTKSIASAHKLCRVMELAVASRAASTVSVHEFSASLDKQQRADALEKLRKSDSKHVLVCSDAMARGIDAASVDLVISYDIPVHVKTYIHRIGRTARAGKAGRTKTIIVPEQRRSFLELVGKAYRGDRTVNIEVHKAKELTEWQEAAQSALRSLEAVLRREDLGLVPPGPLDPRSAREILEMTRESEQTEFMDPEAEDEEEMDKHKAGRDKGAMVMPTGTHLKAQDPGDPSSVNALLRAQIARNFRKSATALASSSG